MDSAAANAADDAAAERTSGLQLRCDARRFSSSGAIPVAAANVENDPMNDPNKQNPSQQQDRESQQREQAQREQQQKQNQQPNQKPGQQQPPQQRDE